MGDLTKPVEGIIKGKVTGDDKMVNTEIGNLETNILKTFNDFSSKFSTEVNSVQENLIEKVKTAYSEPIKIEGKTDSNLNINVKVTDNGGNLIDDAKLKRSLLDDPNFISSLKTVTSGVAAP